MREMGGVTQMGRAWTHPSTHLFGYVVPDRLKTSRGAVLKGRGQLHQRAVVVELVTLPGQLDEELQDLDPVHKVPLVWETPHEEEGHLKWMDASFEHLGSFPEEVTHSVEVLEYGSEVGGCPSLGLPFGCEVAENLIITYALEQSTLYQTELLCCLSGIP